MSTHDWNTQTNPQPTMPTEDWNTIGSRIFREACTTIVNDLDPQITMERLGKSSTNPSSPFIGTSSIEHPNIHKDWDCAVEAFLISRAPTEAPDKITIDTKTEIFPVFFEKIQGFELGFSDKEVFLMRKMCERDIKIRDDVDLKFIYLGPSNHPKGSLGCPTGPKEKDGKGRKGSGAKRGGDGGFNVMEFDGGFNAMQIDGGFNAIEDDGAFNVLDFSGGSSSKKRRLDGDK